MDNLLEQPANTFEPIERLRQFMKQSQLLLQFMGYWILASCEPGKIQRPVALPQGNPYKTIAFCLILNAISCYLFKEMNIELSYFQEMYPTIATIPWKEVVHNFTISRTYNF